MQKILDLKGKVIVDTDLHKLSDQTSKLSDQTSKLTEATDKISLGNRKLKSELVVSQNVNSRLEEKIINLEKNQANGEQCSRRNNVELSDIPNIIPDEDLENTVINICKELGIDVEARRMPPTTFSRDSKSHDKRVIVKFFNRKYRGNLVKV